VIWNLDINIEIFENGGGNLNGLGTLAGDEGFLMICEGFDGIDSFMRRSTGRKTDKRREAGFHLNCAPSLFTPHQFIQFQTTFPPKFGKAIFDEMYGF
jgi:hypothetical protein